MLAKTPADIGRLIRAARTDAQMSQSHLASLCGTTQSWISEIENGKATAELGMVLKVLSVLKVDMELKDSRSSVPPDPIWPDHDEPDIDGIVGGPRLKP